MKLIKKNIGKTILKCGAVYTTSLFECPVCKQRCERVHSAGLKNKTCSRACAHKYNTDDRFSKKSSLCVNCAVLKCDWLLNGKPINGWNAKKVKYPSSKAAYKTTYTVKSCPNYKPFSKNVKRGVEDDF